MMKNIPGAQRRKEEILRLGKEGRTTLEELSAAWHCSKRNISEYLHRLQEKEKYAYFVDGKGYFRIFREVE